MPEVSRFYGIVVKIFYDDHNPPHFHAEYGEHEALVNINTKAVRGEYYRRLLKEGANVVILDPDVAKTFRSSAAVNEALRSDHRNVTLDAARPRTSGGGNGEHPPAYSRQVAHG
jgi:hypothetical protein